MGKLAGETTIDWSIAYVIAGPQSEFTTDQAYAVILDGLNTEKYFILFESNVESPPSDPVDHEGPCEAHNCTNRDTVPIYSMRKENRSDPPTTTGNDLGYLCVDCTERLARKCREKEDELLQMVTAASI